MLVVSKLLYNLSTLWLTDSQMNQIDSFIGHILRRPLRHHSRIVAFNRFLKPQILGGPFRPGNRRGKWAEHVLATAANIFNDHFFRGEGGQRDMKHKICEVANDRVWWSRVLGETRSRWRRLREGPVVHAHGG